MRGRNDDSSTGPIALDSDVTFFGTTYNSPVVNNGDVTFTAPLSSYVPSGPTGADGSIVSAWFGDVDTRGAGGGIVRHDVDAAVRQLVVIGIRSATMAVIPTGEGQIGVFYRNMNRISANTASRPRSALVTGAATAWCSKDRPPSPT